MADYIVKPHPDEDFYVVWSTIIDNWTKAGTRAELTEMLPTHDVSADRWERADDNGSSANWTDWPKYRQPFAWNDYTFVVHNHGIEGEGGCVLQRCDLKAWVETGDKRLLQRVVYDDDGDELRRERIS